MKVLHTLLSVAILLLLLGAVGLFVIRPIVTAFGDRADTIASLERQISAFRDRRTRLAERQRLQVGEPAILEGATPALAGVALQELVDVAVSEAGAELESRRMEEAIPLDWARKIPITLDLTIEMEGLQELLYKLETSTPYLFIENLDIQRVRGSDNDGPQRLSARITVFGLLPPAS